MAQTNNLSCYRSEAITVGVTMSPVVDITGWMLVFTLKASQYTTAPLVTITGTILDGPSGTFQIPLAATDTDHDPQAYAYDIWRTDVGSESLISLGQFNILQP